MRRPKAICFDMGYTLLMHAPTGPDLYQRVLADCGIEVGLKALAEATAPAHEHYIRSVREGRDFEASMGSALSFFRNVDRWIRSKRKQWTFTWRWLCSSEHDYRQFCEVPVQS